jgi:hypothetical protein
MTPAPVPGQTPFRVTQDGIDTLTASDATNSLQCRSRGESTLVPNSECVSSKLFDEATWLKMVLDVESIGDSGMDTYATFRLSERVNVYLLAKQMGTSVKMIENHYGHITLVKHADLTLKGLSGWGHITHAARAQSGGPQV